MPHQAEGNANNVLGHLLRPMLGEACVVFESTQVLAGHSGKRPDILITAPGRSPVVIEAEYDPARTVEPEARERLGMEVEGQPRPIEAAIALRYPAGVDDAYDQRVVIADALLRYCVYTGDGGNADRFPETGWLSGGVADLADLVRLVSVPQNAVDQAATYLEQGIDGAANVLEELNLIGPAINASIARLLGMDNVPQTRRMACAIIANAMIFHDRIAGMHEEVSALNLVCGDGVPDPQGTTLSAWTAILNINYWPIFAIGKDILEQLPAEFAVRILRRLRLTAASVNGTGVNNAHDLTGRVFQRLISDRKYLATFYTQPPSAALLARLAVAKIRPHPNPLPEGEGTTKSPPPSDHPEPVEGRTDGGEGEFDWSDPSAIGKLRIADFACGTGALLSAVYEQVAARHEQAGGDAKAIHPAMMEEVLYGCDVMPSAIHITGSTLAGIQPDVMYGRSRLYTMPYGRQEDGTVKIGSLELLQSSSVMTLFNTSDPAMRTGSVGQETAAQINAEIPDAGFDLVIMNPPFTRNTTREGATADAVAAAFAAFDASEADQRDMAKRMGELRPGTSYHGNAGVASAFSGLAHRKLKPGGVLALVLPLSAAVGIAWQNFREMVARNYTELEVLSIAANGNNMAFSSDTGMAECLVIARKLRDGEFSTERVQFATFVQRPASLASASVAAGNFEDRGHTRRIEDGPFGGTRLTIGDELAGEMLTAPCSADGDGWAAVRVLDYSLAQTAYAVQHSRLNLPGIPEIHELPIESLGNIAKIGLYHLDIVGTPSRGPFNKIGPSATATYPALWNHDAKKETRIICAPDSQLEVRPGMETKAATVWGNASRIHINAEYTFGAQPLAVAFTERDSLGGSAWPNVIFSDSRFDYAFAVWSNCTLGLLAYWWRSSRQQSSKARMTVRTAETLPVLDFRALSDEQLAAAEGIFDEFRELELMPAYLADADPNRALLDRRVVCDLLGFGEDVYRAVRRLSAKWCAEPSVHGGKARPRSAAYAE